MIVNSNNDSKIDQSKPASLKSYILIINKWKKFIIINFLIVAVVSVISSLILPKWYKSTASVMPPANTGLLNQIGGASSLLRNLSIGPKLGGLSDRMGAYNYMAILKSRTAMEDMINKFDLMKVYEISDTSVEKTILELENNVNFNIEDEDFLTITVWDKNPNRAAEMANYFVEILNKMSIQFATYEAKNNREFIEMRLNQAKEDLTSAENNLRDYFEKHKILIAPDEKGSGLAAFAELYAMKVKKEIELAILGKTFSKENDFYRKTELELNAIENKVKGIPERGIESLRLYREVLIQQKIIEILFPLYEQAKIEEQKEIPIIVVLDKAKPAEKKDKPKRSILVLLICSGCLAITLFSIFSYEIFWKSENIQDIRRAIKSKKTSMD
ncbi:hypothetical protein FJY84_02745 [Candidatus Bathyarchaeota archaeon]|nr:hypothetical protein [Candidatus Bathyarchaeota archaeon]